MLHHQHSISWNPFNIKLIAELWGFKKGGGSILRSSWIFDHTRFMPVLMPWKTNVSADTSAFNCARSRSKFLKNSNCISSSTFEWIPYYGLSRIVLSRFHDQSPKSNMILILPPFLWPKALDRVPSPYVRIEPHLNVRNWHGLEFPCIRDLPFVIPDFLLLISNAFLWGFWASRFHVWGGP